MPRIARAIDPELEPCVRESKSRRVRGRVCHEMREAILEPPTNPSRFCCCFEWQHRLVPEVSALTCGKGSRVLYRSSRMCTSTRLRANNRDDPVRDRSREDEALRELSMRPHTCVLRRRAPRARAESPSRCHKYVHACTARRETMVPRHIQVHSREAHQAGISLWLMQGAGVFSTPPQRVQRCRNGSKGTTDAVPDRAIATAAGLAAEEDSTNSSASCA